MKLCLTWKLKYRYYVVVRNTIPSVYLCVPDTMARLYGKGYITKFDLYLDERDAEAIVALRLALYHMEVEGDVLTVDADHKGHLCSQIHHFSYNWTIQVQS